MTEPAPGVLVSTRATTPNALATTADSAMMSLEVELRSAQAIARAGDVLPRQYRDKPGAILLVQKWAQDRGVDLLTAIQTVSFIDGRPVVDASMQRALAERAGYEVRIVSADDDQATVEIHSGDRMIGSATYTHAQATAAGLASKKNWQQNREDMLVARASTRALKRFAPSVMLGMLTEADDGNEDALDTLTSQTPVAEVTGAAEGTSSDDAPSAAAPTDIVDAEVVTDPEPAPAAAEEPATLDLAEPTMTADELRARIKPVGMSQAALIRLAQAIDPAYGSLQLIADAPAEHLAIILRGIDSAAEAKAAAEEPF